MPVVFAQPEPFAPQLSAAYGASQQARQDMPLLADAYARQAAVRAQRQAGDGGQGAALAAQLMARQNEANYGNIQQSLIRDSQRQTEEQELALKARQIAQAGMYTNRDAFQDEAEAQTRAGLVQLQSYMQSQELTYAEQLRMKRLQDGISYVNSLPTIDRETKAAIATQMMTEVNPYQMRAQNAAVKQREQEVQQMTQHAQLVTQLQTGTEAQVAEARSKLFITRQNPYTGQAEEFFLKPDGTLQNLTFTKPEKVAEAKPWTYEDESAMTASAGVIAKARAGGRDESGTPLTADEIAARAADMLPKVMDELRAKEPRLQPKPGQGAQAFQQGPPPQPAPSRAENKPYQPGKPATADQKAQEGAWQTFEDRAGSFGGEQGGQVRGQIKWARQALATFGDRTAMPPEVREMYDKILQSMTGLRSPGTRPPIPFGAN